MVVEKEIGDDVTIVKEQNAISSSLSRVSDAGLRERIRDRIPKATKDCTSWAVKAWLEWGEDEIPKIGTKMASLSVFRTTSLQYLMWSLIIGSQSLSLKFGREKMVRLIAEYSVSNGVWFTAVH